MRTLWNTDSSVSLLQCSLFPCSVKKGIIGWEHKCLISVVSCFYFVSKAEHRERSKFKSERNDLESSYVPVSAPPPSSSEQYSSGAQSIPSTVTVIAPAHHSENTTESWSNYYNNHSSSNSFGRNPPPKRRCRDYDGKNCPLDCTPKC